MNWYSQRASLKRVARIISTADFELVLEILFLTSVVCTTPECSLVKRENAVIL